MFFWQATKPARIPQHKTIITTSEIQLKSRSYYITAVPDPVLEYIIHLYEEALGSRDEWKTSNGPEARSLGCPGAWHVHSCHTEALSLLLSLDKTSYSTMSNLKVNVILLTFKINWGYGRLTLFLSRAGTSRPTLLKELCIRQPGAQCMCVWMGGEGGFAKDRWGQRL